MTTGKSDQQGRSRRLPQLTGWVVVLLGLTFGAGYLYYLHLEDRKVFIDTYYFRTLQEVATEFNNNLGQLVSLHKYGESRSTIQSIFPSYQESGEPVEAETDEADGNLTEVKSYRLEANRVTINLQLGTTTQSFVVGIEDLMPQPSNDFVLYVIADSGNRVLSSTGGASGLSMIDTEVVSNAIQLRESQDWLKLATKQGFEEPEAGKSLPGYSTQIDVELTTGKSRLFVLPFQLQHEIGVPARNGDSQQGDYQSGGVSLYLLGLQPERVIDAYDNRRWNLSLLLLSLVALVFLWTVARLLMLSRHQPLGSGFYRITISASYLTFILLVALLVAFAHRNSEIAIKHGKANELIQHAQTGLSGDLRAILPALDEYHRFYAGLLPRALGRASECPEEAQATEGIAATGCAEDATVAGDSAMLPLEESTLVIRLADGKELEKKEVVGGTMSEFLGVLESLEEYEPEDERDLPPFSFINVFGPCADVTLKESTDAWQVSESYSLERDCTLPADGRLLIVFLMNKEGQQILPAFYYAENNTNPESYSLAHRDYFRRVRDQAGWNLPPHDSGLDSEAEFYIQRLLNLRTGTRGSTIGMPLRYGKAEDAEGLVLGADIVLPSLSLTEWDQPELIQDMVVMVIDRVSGQVLYHMDRSRSMIENLYQAGRGTAKISQSIRSGRFRPVSGYYHGAGGEFVAAPLPVSQWAMVVFIPDAGTDSLMTNTFLVSAIGMAATLFLLAGLLALLRRYWDTDGIKKRLGIPSAVDRYGAMLYTSILITAIYVSFWLGEIIGLQTGSDSQVWSRALCLTAVVVVLLWGFSVLRSLRRHDRFRAQLERNAGWGTAALFTVFALIGVGMSVYLDYIGNKPDDGLTWYYDSLHEARLNQEAEELHDVALTRYPNSIKLHKRDPLSLLPISCGWRETLSNHFTGARENASEPDAGACAERAGMVESAKRKEEHVLPEHVGTFSQYTATTGLYEWILRFMLGLEPSSAEFDRSVPDCRSDQQEDGSVADEKTTDCTDDRKEEASNSGNQGSGLRAEDSAPIVRFVIVYAFAYLLLCVLWYLFTRWVIGARLLGPPGLIQHLKYIVDRNVPERDYDPRPDLVLDLRCGRHAGHDLSALLIRCSMDSTAGADVTDASGAGGELDAACRGMAEILGECSWLKSEKHANDWFPGARISFDFGEDRARRHGEVKRGGQPAVIRLSDLDVCLSDKELRGSLLRLIRHLKARCLAGELAELRLNLGFHSYEALLLKAHNIEPDRDPMTNAEMADWAETLMDFTVALPEELTAQLDSDFVDYECSGSGLLRRLADELPGHSHAARPGWRRHRRWLGLRDYDKTGAEWATINCILLKAGALFRYKWESCSGAEKLALYFLAKRKRVNTANAQLLEQLALQGLIRVEHGSIRIVNNSFAYFARHAEDTSTLKDLVDAGGIGAWQDYRLPVTLVVLLLLGGIAFTSGSSLYMIAASLLGLLATIGSLTSSAHMIRENLR